MSARPFSTPHPATCEDYDEDAQATVPDSTKSANVAARRSRQELVSARSYDGWQASENIHDNPSRNLTAKADRERRRKEKRSVALRVDTDFPERESRPYHYPEGRTENQRPLSSRPAVHRSESKANAERAPFRHRRGECWICDEYGYHIEPPPRESFTYARATPLPPSPQSTRPPSPQKQAADNGARRLAQDQPHVMRSSSQRALKTMSFHAGMQADMYHPSMPQPTPFELGLLQSPSATYFTAMSPMPMSYPPAHYVQTPLTAVPHYVDVPSPMYPMPSPHQPPPPEFNRHSTFYSSYGQPLVQYSSNPAPPYPLEPTISHREHRPPLASKPSREEYDRSVMPPPPRPQEAQLVVAHRPALKKAVTGMSAATIQHRPQQHEAERKDHQPIRPSPPSRDHRADPPIPPSSYRPPPISADRPPAKKFLSYTYPKHSTEIASSRPKGSNVFPRRNTFSNTENLEAEAEAYQRYRGSTPESHALTADALKKISAQRMGTRSDTGSSQRSRNSSSKGSSGAKTGKSASDITMTINGVTLGFSGDSTERQNINIQPKDNGGVNISVGGKEGNGKEYVVTKMERTPSFTSKTSRTTKSSRSGGEKDKSDERDRERKRSVPEAASEWSSRRSSPSKYRPREEPRFDDELPEIYGA